MHTYIGKPAHLQAHKYCMYTPVFVQNTYILAVCLSSTVSLIRP